MKMLNNILNEDLDEESIAVAREFLPSVRPLFTVNERFGPELKASCVLFSLEDIRLIITAGHVFDDLQGSAIYVGGEKRLVQLRGQYFRTKPNGSLEKDRFDLAFMELDADALAIIGNIRFLQSGDLDPNDIAAKSHLYCILGYPATKNVHVDYERHKTLLTPYIFSSNSPDFDVYRRINILEESHILINFDRKRTTNKTYKILTAPKLHGISGGGIWRIRDYSKVASLSGPSAKKLVGIIIESHPMHKVIIGVRISCVIEAVRTNYPQFSEKLPSVNRINAHINKK
jgi:hypothetical protein